MCVTDRHDMALAVKVALNPKNCRYPEKGNRRHLPEKEMKSLASLPHQCLSC